jgi:hypothetical protein
MPMSRTDQETAAALARIGCEWRRLEAERAELEAAHARWRDTLLATAVRLGMGERFGAAGLDSAATAAAASDALAPQ